MQNGIIRSALFSAKQLAESKAAAKRLGGQLHLKIPVARQLAGPQLAGPQSAVLAQVSCAVVKMAAVAAAAAADKKEVEMSSSFDASCL